MSESNDQSTSRNLSFMNSIRRLLFGVNLRQSIWICIIGILGTIGVVVFIKVGVIQYTPTGVGTSGQIALESASYSRLVTLLIDTYTGETNQVLFIIVPPALLIGAIISAYLNEGLVPVAMLVMGPIFGFFINRVGMPTVPGLDPEPLPLTEGIIFALTGTLLYGIPLVLLGFFIGLLCRRIGTRLSSEVQSNT